MQRLSVRLAVTVCLAAMLAACEGPMGPAGIPGPGTRLVLNATANNAGTAVVNLPPEAGTLDDPPVVACYISSNGQFWSIIAFDSDSDTDVETGTDFAGFFGCFLDQGPGNTILVVAEPIPPGWLLRVVVVY
jgi:hypothetical protein